MLCQEGYKSMTEMACNRGILLYSLCRGSAGIEFRSVVVSRNLKMK